MATLPISVPDNKLSTVIEAYSQDWSNTLDNGQPNPLTRIQHAKLAIVRHLKQPVINYETQKHQLPNFDTSGITLD